MDRDGHTLELRLVLAGRIHEYDERSTIHQPILVIRYKTV